MANRAAYFGTLVIFVAAAFFVGLVVGVNYGRSSAELPEDPASVVQHTGRGTGEEMPAPQGRETGSATAKTGALDYPKAPDFELEEPGTGETVGLADFAGSNLVLLITTTT